ncbi:glycosyltransferase [Salinarimonas ramus]|uniref:Glycosyl transferase family 1 n=1 Tax=Salinarimonas ramus TaxID=690164 RepID=A0A917V4X5_9HYPH|nr:glycosyltransferase [Salinarimonas ramus]GGK38228.1 glycosyl transferase family 1 [Salinarimonas ramus]
MSTDASLVALFGHDAYDSTVRKRIAGIRDAGRRVIGFTFARRRPEDSRAPEIFWENVALGETRDRNYAKRLPVLAAALPRVLRHARALREARVIYARNIDMMGLAVAAKRLTGSRATLVYEVLDVQRVFLREDAAGRAFRAAERRALREADRLVVSAPAFVARYFEPMQAYRGPWSLLENKIPAARIAAAPARFARTLTHPPLDGPIVIGWFGVLRCARSLVLLEEIAARLGSRVRIVLRGKLAEEDVSRERLAAATARCPNIVYEGPYASPDDLADLYGGVHYTWALDYTDAGANSDWLLPNRLYEGGYFGAPTLAREGTEVGRRVAADDLGLALPEPPVEAVCALVEGCDAPAYVAQRERLLARPPAAFVDEHDTAALLDDLERG